MEERRNECRFGEYILKKVIIWKTCAAMRGYIKESREEKV
jgi:hypothetical protein